MNAVHVLPQQPAPRHIDARFDVNANNTLWITLSRSPHGDMPYFSLPLLQELMALLQSMKQRGVTWSQRGTQQPVHYAVMRSAHPDYFSLGGDLAYFHDCIHRHDRAALNDYSLTCADMLYEWSTTLSTKATTIALVQGRALGGGFETALAADVIVAEEHSEFGFPEILFGLFPCTGGMTLLSQRVGARAAERMLGDSRIYTATELKEMGVVDEICPKGQGERTVENFIAAHARQRPARMMLQRSRHRIAPLDRAELRTVAGEWTETAMGLGKQELRVMDLLVKMQRGRAVA